MKYLETIYGFIQGYILFAIFFSIKMAFIAAGPMVATIPIIACHYAEKQRLPFLWWFWDNVESGYHNRGFGIYYNDPMSRTGGDARIYKKLKAEGKSDLYISLNWSLIRNPANNITRNLGCKLNKLTESVFRFVSLSKHDGKRVSYTYRGNFYKDARVQWLWSPFPERLRAAMGEDALYFDIQLSKIKHSSFFSTYYPMIRIVKCIPEKLYTEREFKFFKKADNHDELSKLQRVLKFNIIKISKTKVKRKKHWEFILGFKTYAYMVEYSLTNRGHLLGNNGEGVRSAAINLVYRKDEDWA